MIIKLFGQLQQNVERTEQEVSGSTIREALENLCEDNPTLHEAIFNGNTLNPFVRIMVNGQDCELLDGLETALTADDRIAIFPPIAGG